MIGRKKENEQEGSQQLHVSTTWSVMEGHSVDKVPVKEREHRGWLD